MCVTGHTIIDFRGHNIYIDIKPLPTGCPAINNIIIMIMVIRKL